MSLEQQKILLDKTVENLREHFDTVQILVTVAEPDGTVNLSAGSGNWFARYGQAVCFIEREREVNRKTTSRMLDEE